MPISGKWHDREQSQEYAAELVITDDQFCQVFPCTQIDSKFPANNISHIIAEAPLKQLKISDRLGSLPRRLNFPNDGVFVTENNQAVDDYLLKLPNHKKINSSFFGSKIHAMESSFSIVIICIALVIGCVFAITKYGIPYTADKVSQHIPEELIAQINKSTLEQLDDSFLHPSLLPENRQQELRDYFAQLESEERVVLFRKGGKAIGANAFALPGSTIVFTDQMVELAEHDEELLSIYFHETGHISYRHSIRSALQSSAIALFITFVTGDGSGIAESLYTIPIILAHSAYSRKFEAEADDHTYKMMQTYKIPLHRFADIMMRLEKKYSEEEGNGKLSDYFSSHPATVDRIAKFQNN